MMSLSQVLRYAVVYSSKKVNLLSIILGGMTSMVFQAFSRKTATDLLGGNRNIQSSNMCCKLEFPILFLYWLARHLVINCSLHSLFFDLYRGQK